jgi:hypothetical protein
MDKEPRFIPVLRVGVYIIMTGAAEADKVIEPECDIRIGRAAYALDDAVVHVMSRTQAPLALVPVPVQRCDPCRAPPRHTSPT